MVGLSGLSHGAGIQGPLSELLELSSRVRVKGLRKVKTPTTETLSLYKSTFFKRNSLFIYLFWGVFLYPLT